MKFLTLLVSIVVVFSNGCNGARILSLFHIDSYSHNILGYELSKELSEKGHQVTMISAKKGVQTNPNFKIIHLDYPEPENPPILKDLILEMLQMSAEKMFVMASSMGGESTEQLYKHPKVKKHLQEDHQYDLVIVEQFFSNALLGFCAHYKAPCVILSTVGANSLVNYVVRNPAPPSYVPDIFLPYGAEMSLLERTRNVLFQIFFNLYNNLCILPKHNAIIQEHLPGVPHLDTILYNVSLILLNSHPSYTQPVPKVANMVEVGGMHIRAAENLPADIQKFLDGATHGAIYFSLGSSVQSSFFPKEKLESILKVFSKLKQRVLWKFEDEHLPNQPENVKILKWAPQRDILAHPNIKLFITHGGLLSLSEAVHNGVPLIGIPFYGDQRANLAEVERIGVGTIIGYDDLNEKSLTDAINKVLLEKTFSENMKQRSAVYHDRNMKPMDAAVYWIEFLLRHRGAPHLRSPGLDLKWYQYWLQDVAVLLALVLTLPLAVIVTIRRICKKKMAKKPLKDKKH